MNNMIQRIPEVQHEKTWYQLYPADSKDVDNSLLIRAFMARYGYEPKEIICQPGGRLAGPIEMEAR